eukprot:6176887-Pleurochrysis_carterae.AAC.3
MHRCERHLHMEGVDNPQLAPGGVQAGVSLTRRVDQSYAHTFCTSSSRLVIQRVETTAGIQNSAGIALARIRVS